jgi:RHS repeat-associated protein
MKFTRKASQTLSFLLIFALLTGILPTPLSGGVVSLATEIQGRNFDDWKSEVIDIPAHGKMYSELSQEEKDELIEAFNTSDDVFAELETLGVCVTSSIGHINMASQHNLPVGTLVEGAVLHDGIDSLARELHRLDNHVRDSKNLTAVDIDGIQALILLGNQFPVAIELYAEANDLDLEFLYEQKEMDGNTEYPIMPLNTGEYNPLNLIAAPFSYSASENSRVNLNTGEYTHEEVDLVLPGKNGLDLEIRRRFDSSIPATNSISWGDGSTAIIYEITYAFYYPVGRETDDLGVQALESMRINPHDPLFNWTSNLDLRDFQMTFRATQRELAVAFRNSLSRGTTLLMHTLNSGGTAVLFRPVINVREGTLWTEANAMRLESGAIPNQHGDPHGLGHGWSYAFSRIETYWTAVVGGRSVYEDYIRLSDGRFFRIDMSNTPSRLAGYKRRDLVFARSSNTSTLTHADGKVETFDNNGRLTQIRDRFGNTISFAYTANNGITITDTLGRVVTLNQGANSNQRVLIAPDNSRKTFNTRIGTGNIRFLDNAVDQSGHTTTYLSHANTMYFNPFSPDWVNVHPGFAQTTHRVILDRVTFPSGMQIRYETTSRVRTLDGVGYIEYPALFRRYSVVTQQGATVRTDAEEFSFTGNFCGFRTESFNFNNNRFISERREVFLYSTPGGFVSHPKSVQSHLFNHNQLTRRTDTRLSNQELPYPVNHDSATFNALVNGMNWRTIQTTTYTYDDFNLPSVVREEIRCYLNPSSSPMIRENRYVHDDRGNVTRHTNPDGRIANFTYFANFSLPNTMSYNRDANTTINIVNTLTTGNRTIASTEIREGTTPRERTEFQYDTFGNVIQQRQFINRGATAFTDPVDTHFSYNDTQGRTGFNGAYLTETRTEGVQDAAGALAAGTPGRPAGTVATRASFDIMGRLQTSTDANGNVTSYQYDPLGNVTRVTNPDNSFSTYVRDYINNRLTVTDEIGGAIEYTYLQSGELAQVRDVVNNRLLSTYIYDPGMRLREETIHLSPTNTRRTVYRYDTQDRLLGERIYGANSVILSDETYIYHDTHTNGQFQRVQKTVHDNASAPNIVTTSYTNRMGFEARTGYFLGGSERLNTFTHDFLGNVTEMRTALDAQRGQTFTMRYQYDHANRVTRETNTLNQVLIREYDRLGRNTGVTDHAGNTTNFAFDILNRQISKSVPFEGTHRAVTRYFYDPAGNITREQTQNNVPGVSAAWTRTDYEYTNRGFLRQADSFNGNTLASRVFYTHDPAGNILTMRTGTAAANFATTTYTYDKFGNVETITDALGQTETFDEYDRMKNPLRKTDRNGTVTIFTYDGLSRPLTITAGSDATSYSYTLTGEIRTQTQGGFTQTNTYDAIGNLTRQEEPGGIVKVYQYDIGGNRTHYTVNGVTTRYEYDALNRLERVFENNVLQATYAYDANGNRASLTLANNVTTRYTYNLANLVTGLTNRRGTAANAPIVSSYTYTYFLDGNQRTKTDHTGRVTTYSYDGLGRLTQEAESGGADPSANMTLAYTFDARGNRETMTVSGAENYAVDYSYDLNNRLLESNKQIGEFTETSVFAYDANGNQLSDGVKTFEYDGFNRMVSAQIGGVSTSYTYRPDGLRHSKTTREIHFDPITTVHVWDGSNISLDITGENTVKYIRGIGLIAADGLWGYEGRQFYLFNAHGSVVQLADSTGNVTQSYDYDAFGNERKPPYGDVNGDGVIDAADVTMLRSYIAARAGNEDTYAAFLAANPNFNRANADVNGDGFINSADVTQLRRYLAATVPATVQLGAPDGNNFRFAGEYWDWETQTYYLRARVYSPIQGRFLTADPFWNVANMVFGDDPIRWNERPVDPDDPLGLTVYTLKPDMLVIQQNGNLYVYCMGNPVMFIDPSGEWFMPFFKGYWGKITRSPILPPPGPAKRLCKDVAGRLIFNCGCCDWARYML